MEYGSYMYISPMNFLFFFFPIVTDNDYVYQTTNSIGRVNFNNLCYGDDALIFVFGGSLETRSCSIFDEKIKIGSTDFMNVYTNCKWWEIKLHFLKKNVTMR